MGISALHVVREGPRAELAWGLTPWHTRKVTHCVARGLRLPGQISIILHVLAI